MKATILIIITVFTLAISGCGPSSPDERVLDASKFEQMVRDSNDKIILDVRTPDEFAEGHMQGALLINVNNPEFRDQISEFDKSKTIFVYCAAGIRSEKASVILKDAGFEKVYHLKGGLKAWKQELTK